MLSMNTLTNFLDQMLASEGLVLTQVGQLHTTPDQLKCISTA